MKTLVVIIAGFLFSAPAFAQQAGTAPALPTDPQQVQSLIESSGCRYEVNTAAQTIANLQKRINELEKQLAKDPPKSGATKH
jgi:NAD-dependent oxidoreductase involved in siderophore biosynthesis